MLCKLTEIIALIEINLIMHSVLYLTDGLGHSHR